MLGPTLLVFGMALSCGESEPGDDASMPPAWAACELPSDCVLAASGCCGVCGAPELDDVDAVHRERLEQHSAAVCPDPGPCPDCAESPNPSLVATCRNDTCVAVDVREHAASACATDSQCRLRVRGCCECGSSIASWDLIAISYEGEAAYQALACDPEQPCDECAPVYPSEIEAYCAPGGHCSIHERDRGVCEAIAADYAAAFDEASACDPSAALDQCTERVTLGLACSCSGFANPEQVDALERASQAQAAYHAQTCGGGIVCGPCLEPPRGRCSDAGRCENVYEPQADDQ